MGVANRRKARKSGILMREYLNLKLKGTQKLISNLRLAHALWEGDRRGAELIQ